MTHICVGKLSIIGSDNVLSPGRRQAIIWTNVAILLTGHLGPNFREKNNRNAHIFIQENRFENVVWKKAAISSRPQCVHMMASWWHGTFMYNDGEADSPVETNNKGWGLLSQFPPFRYFPIFSTLSKQLLAIGYHVYIWQVSPQLNWGGTSQIWMWSK